MAEKCVAACSSAHNLPNIPPSDPTTTPPDIPLSDPATTSPTIPPSDPATTLPSQQQPLQQQDKDSSNSASDDFDIDSLEDIEDPTCSPTSPVKVSFDEVVSATERIRDGIVVTPCHKSDRLSNLALMDIYLKCDFQQRTGSFKERGARNFIALMTAEQRAKGVVAASAGNHAQAVSYHGGQLGAPVTVAMPVTAPIMKIQKCKEYGATVIVKGKDMGEAKKIGLNVAKKNGSVYLNGFDNPQVIAGQGSAALELMEQVPDLDCVVVPIGGGGLLAGIAVGVKGKNPDVKVIGVEAERAAGWTNALSQGRPVETAMLPSLADGLSVPVVGYNAFETAKDLVDKVILVDEQWIAISILRLVENEKCIVEGAGAVTLAAVLSGQLNEFRGKKVALILSGGNIDTTILGRCLERGLAADGRLVKVKVIVRDRPGGIAELLAAVASVGVSVKHVTQERAWVFSDVYSVQVKVICETRDYPNSVELKELLCSKYDDVRFDDFPARRLSVPLV